MGQTELETRRENTLRLDKRLYNEYIRLLRQFNLLSEDTVSAFEHNKPSVVFYAAGSWPAIEGDNQNIASYNPTTNAIFEDAQPLIADNAVSPELKATEEAKRIGLVDRVVFAAGKFRTLTYALISALPHNKERLVLPSELLDEQGKISWFFSGVKREAIAEGVTHLFLSELDEPYSTPEFLHILREMDRNSVKSTDSTNEEPEDRLQRATYAWSVLLQYKGPNELRSALRKPLVDRTNKSEEEVYQRITKWWEEGIKTRPRAKAVR